MKKLINIFKRISNILIEILITALNPFLLAINDVIKVFADTNTMIAKVIVNIPKTKNIDRYSTILYYLILTLFDILLLANVLEGKILYIRSDNLLVYSMIIIVIITLLINFFIRHSTLSKRFKYFTICQILILFPILIGYWIVSIEGQDFYFKNLNVDQWMALFNNIIIYFATCFLGILVAYKEDKKKEE